MKVKYGRPLPNIFYIKRKFKSSEIIGYVGVTQTNL